MGVQGRALKLFPARHSGKVWLCGRQLTIFHKGVVVVKFTSFAANTHPQHS